MRLGLILSAALVLGRAGAGVVEYLSGAELQCENPGAVASSLLFLLDSDASEIRTHLFPDYRGVPCWTLGEFLDRYFVPAEAGTAYGTDPASEITTVEARRIIREFYARLGCVMESAPIRH